MSDNLVVSVLAGIVLGAATTILFRGNWKLAAAVSLAIATGLLLFVSAVAADTDTEAPLPVYPVYMPYVVGEARDWFVAGEYVAALRADLERGYMRGAQYTGTMCDVAEGGDPHRFARCRAQFYMGGNTHCVGWFFRRGLDMASMWTCSTSDPGDRVPGV